MKKLSHTESEGKKSVAYKKKMYSKNNRFLFLQKIFFVVMYNDESFKA